jgi:hypothetical protein
VHVDWRRDPESGVIHLEAETPRGVPLRVRLPGETPRLYRSGGQIALTTEGV